MVKTKRKDVTKQGFCKILWRKLRLQWSLLLVLIQFLGGVRGKGVGWGGRLLTFSAFRIGAYSRWALIRGWALIRINTVSAEILCWWRNTTQIWVVLLIGWKFASNSHKHFPDLVSFASLVWNLCTRFSDVTSWGNQWRCREMLALSESERPKYTPLGDT